MRKLDYREKKNPGYTVSKTNKLELSNIFALLKLDVFTMYMWIRPFIHKTSYD
jgi:hypothetical protein